MYWCTCSSHKFQKSYNYLDCANSFGLISLKVTCFYLFVCHRVVIPTNHLGKVFHSFRKATRMGMLLIEAQPDIDLIVFGFNAPPKMNSCWYGNQMSHYLRGFIHPTGGYRWLALGCLNHQQLTPKAMMLGGGVLSFCWMVNCQGRRPLLKVQKSPSNHRLDV